MKTPKIHKAKCPICGKEFSSLSKNQLEFNYYSHFGACKSKLKARGSRELLKAKGKSDIAVADSSIASATTPKEEDGSSDK